MLPHDRIDGRSHSPIIWLPSSTVTYAEQDITSSSIVVCSFQPSLLLLDLCESCDFFRVLFRVIISLLPCSHHFSLPSPRLGRLSNLSYPSPIRHTPSSSPIPLAVFPSPITSPLFLPAASNLSYPPPIHHSPPSYPIPVAVFPSPITSPLSLPAVFLSPPTPPLPLIPVSSLPSRLRLPDHPEAVRVLQLAQPRQLAAGQPEPQWHQSAPRRHRGSV